jgi:hypothetical protein
LRAGEGRAGNRERDGGGDDGAESGGGNGGEEDDGSEEDVGKSGGDGGKGRGGRVEVEVEEEGTSLGSTVFATQSIRGLTFSSQGIPRIIACAPIEETKKVCLWATPAIV